MKKIAKEKKTKIHTHPRANAAIKNNLIQTKVNNYHKTFKFQTRDFILTQLLVSAKRSHKKKHNRKTVKKKNKVH